MREIPERYGPVLRCLEGAAASSASPGRWCISSWWARATEWVSRRCAPIWPKGGASAGKCTCRWYGGPGMRRSGLLRGDRDCTAKPVIGMPAARAVTTGGGPVRITARW